MSRDDPKVLRAMLGAAPFPFAERASGVRLWDTDGRCYLDATGGPFTSSFGHSVPEIVDAITAQLHKVTLTILHHQPAEDLAELILGLAPAGMGGVFFTNSGSEAIEAAIKLTCRYHAARGQPMRTKFIGVVDAYHGTTIGAVSATGHPLFRYHSGWEPLLLPFRHIPPPDPARPVESAQELEKIILAEGAHTIGGFVCEPIFEWADPGRAWFTTIREICDRHGLVLIFDEIRTGFGKMGAPFGAQVRRVVPDIVAFGKGVSGGYAPISGITIQQSMIQALRDAKAHFFHGHTYAGNPLGCASALAVQRYALERGLYERVPWIGSRLDEILRDLEARHENVLGFQGNGVFRFVKLTVPRNEMNRWRAFPILFDAGLIALVFVTGGHFAIALAPPFPFEESDMSELAEKLDVVVRRFAES